MPPVRATIETVGASMNILIYGDMGSGKTTLACSAQDVEEMAPVLVLDIEGGLKSVMHRGDIDFESIESAQHLEDIFYKLINKEKGYKKYKTVILDSVSEFQVLNIEEIVKKRTGGKGDQSDVHLRDYGKSTKRLQKLFREMRDSDLNVIFVAFPSAVYPRGEENVPPELIQPQLTNKLAKSLMGYVDYVWYLELKETKKRTTDGWVTKLKRRLYTRDTLNDDETTIKAKTRGPLFQEALGDIVTNPTMSKIYSLYRES